jgi:isocitrate/isopropylmalate dehydrogenase
MKEIATYGDRYGKWYEVKDSDGSVYFCNSKLYHKTFRSYQDATEYYKELYGKYYCAIDPYEESEEDRIARIAREKALEREKKIDSILG